VSAVIDTHTPIVFQDWIIDPGAEITTPLQAAYNGLVYVFEGAVFLGAQSTPVQEGQLVVLGPGDAVRLHTSAAAGGPARLLLLAGVPLDEPVARHGPFVMNTHAEIAEAVRDYQAGRLGHIVRAVRR
jgi:redox-sensitive bicupin YhaK (pirin superfamily)